MEKTFELTQEGMEQFADNKKAITFRAEYRIWDYLFTRAQKERRSVNNLLNILIDEKITEEIKRGEEI